MIRPQRVLGRGNCPAVSLFVLLFFTVCFKMYHHWIWYISLAFLCCIIIGIPHLLLFTVCFEMYHHCIGISHLLDTNQCCHLSHHQRQVSEKEGQGHCLKCSPSTLWSGWHHRFLKSVSASGNICHPHNRCKIKFTLHFMSNIFVYLYIYTECVI